IRPIADFSRLRYFLRHVYPSNAYQQLVHGRTLLHLSPGGQPARGWKTASDDPIENNLKKVRQFLFEETTATTPASLHREHAIESMLSFRLEGGSSIGAISTMMNRFDCELSSTGSICQTLSQIGGLLPMTVATETGIIRYLVFTSDETVSKSVPILITVDPCSSVT